MYYLVMYDLHGAEQRRKIDKLISARGFRVQASVFECRLKNSQLEELIENLQELLAGGGNIRIYPLCKDCLAKTVGIGDVFVNPAKDGCIII